VGGGTGWTKGWRGGGPGDGKRLEDGAAWGGGGGSPVRGRWGTQPGWAPGPQVCTIWFAIKLKIFQPGEKEQNKTKQKLACWWTVRVAPVVEYLPSSGPVEP
jgi:hypothetical protein